MGLLRQTFAAASYQEARPFNWRTACPRASPMTIIRCAAKRERRGMRSSAALMLQLVMEASYESFLANGIA